MTSTDPYTTKTYERHIDTFDTDPDDSDLDPDDLLATNTFSSEDPTEKQVYNSRPNWLIRELKRYFSVEVPPKGSVSLDKTHHNIKAMRLLSAELVSDLYNCYHITNSQLHIRLKQGPWDIVDSSGVSLFVIDVPPGRYSSISQLLTTIQDTVNQTFKTLSSPPIAIDVFTINYNDLTGAITITSAPGYTFIWSFQEDPEVVPIYRQLRTMLLFPDDLTSYSTFYDNQPSECQRPQLISIFQEYIWIKIQRFNHFYDTRTGQYYFAKLNIINPELTGQVSFILYGYKVFEDGPLSNITHLQISLWDRYGYPITIAPQQVTLTLELIFYQDQLVDTNFSSHRGKFDHTNIDLRHATKIERFP